MTAERVRTDYNQMTQIAQQFGAQAERTQATLQALRQKMSALQGGGWIGRNAARFYAEMDQAVIPALQRLAEALNATQKTSLQISQRMKQAESEAAAVFKYQADAGSAADAGNAWVGNYKGITLDAVVKQAQDLLHGNDKGGGAGNLAGASSFWGGTEKGKALDPLSLGSKEADAVAQQVQDILNGKSKGDSNGKHFRLASSDVILTPELKKKVEALADAYYKRTGKELVVNSGVRTPAKQADAMFTKLQNNDPQYNGLYGKAGQEIRKAYEEGIKAGKSASEIKGDMARVIEKQMQAGIYISPHLRGNAIDIQNKYMSAQDKKAFLEAVKEVGGVRVKAETTPPHYHLTVTD